MILVYANCRALDLAKKTSRDLIEKRLATSIDVWPTEEIYFSAEGPQEQQGAALLIKTNESKMPEVEEALLKIPAHNTPFVGVLDIKRLNRAYKEWSAAVIL